MPHPAPTRIHGEYHPARTPQFVAKWETLTNEAPTDIAALIQLTYFQALQIRMIKLILAWTLIIIPVIITALLIILTTTITTPISRF